MTVPDEAIEAAAKAFHGAMDAPVSFPADWHDEIRAALEAAAPYLRAQALSEAADDPKLRLSGHSGISITRLRARAAAERGGDV